MSHSNAKCAEFDSGIGSPDLLAALMGAILLTQRAERAREGTGRKGDDGIRLQNLKS